MGQAALAAGEDRAVFARAVPAASVSEERRIVALDGVRGLMTIFVLVSHYFGEVPHGIAGLMVGWVAVDIFFVLSGYLIGRLVLEKKHHANFFTVFYVRRIFRLVPVYAIAVLATSALIAAIDRPWVDADVRFPLWSYLTFTQNIFMASTGSIGAHWLAPTWTLAVEEHFYLLVPALLVVVPRRWIVQLLVGGVLLAISLRAAIYLLDRGEMAAMALLPGRADLLLCGVLGAVAINTPGLRWERLELTLRIVPVVSLVAVIGLKLVGGHLFEIWNPLLLGIGGASFLLSIVRGAPEAVRFQSKVLRFFGDNSYSIYLTHLPILGLAHGLAFAERPDLVSPAQWLVTLAALPVSVLVGWAMTRAVEAPMTRYGRSWTWSAATR